MPRFRHYIRKISCFQSRAPALFYEGELLLRPVRSVEARSLRPSAAQIWCLSRLEGSTRDRCLAMGSSGSAVSLIDSIICATASRRSPSIKPAIEFKQGSGNVIGLAAVGSPLRYVWYAQECCHERRLAVYHSSTTGTDAESVDALRDTQRGAQAVLDL